MKIQMAGIQCPAHWVGYGDKTDSYDTKEHRNKYHSGKQATVKEIKKYNISMVSSKI